MRLPAYILPAHYSDEELVADVATFQMTYLPEVDPGQLLRAARVAKDIKTYDEVARSPHADAGLDLPVQLSVEEKRALKREKDVAISERGMYIVILTVSLAAFLQGHVQSRYCVEIRQPCPRRLTSLVVSTALRCTGHFLGLVAQIRTTV